MPRRPARCPLAFLALALWVVPALLAACESQPTTDPDRKAKAYALYEGYKKDFPEAVEIRPEEAMKRWQDDGVVFIDARSPDEFAMGHIPGARSLPQETMYGDLDAAAKALGLTAEDRLMVYCGNLLCDKSKELAEALRTAGYPYVTVVTDGYEGWTAAGGPTEGGI